MPSSRSAGRSWRVGTARNTTTAPTEIIVEVVGEIDNKIAERVTRQIAQVSPTGRIEMRIASHGGAPRAAIDIATRLRLYKGQTAAIVTGQCDSAAVIVLAACRARYANSERTFQMHATSLLEPVNVAGRQTGQALRAEAARLEGVDQIVREFVSTCIGCSVAELAEIEQAELRLTAKGALEIGLLTGVLGHPEWVKERDARRRASLRAEVQASIKDDIIRAQRPLSQADKTLLTRWAMRCGGPVMGMHPAALLRMLEQQTS